MRIFLRYQHFDRAGIVAIFTQHFGELPIWLWMKLRLQREPSQARVRVRTREKSFICETVYHQSPGLGPALFLIDESSNLHARQVQHRTVFKHDVT